MHIIQKSLSTHILSDYPTTKVAILTTVQTVSQNLKQSQYALEIQKELNSLSTGI